MTIKYTITEVSSDAILVEYPDKSFARIAINKGENKAALEARIRDHYHPLIPFDSSGDVPVTKGDTGEVKTREEEAKDRKDEAQTKYWEQSVTYTEMRENEYPSPTDQLEDLYLKGAFSDAMTAKIKSVKDKYPKDTAPVSRKAYDEAISAASEQVSFLETIKERVKTRIAICKRCPAFLPNTKRCEECGCFLPAKAAVSTMDCPLNKWPR